VAVVFGECVLTYRELRARASHLAQHLRALGVGPQVIVGLRVKRSPEMVVALLGILEAGGAYWAVEENLPEDRLRMLLAAARPRVLLVRQNSKTNWAMLAEHTPDSPRAAPILAVLEDLLTSPAPPNVPALCPSQPGDPAYVSYTSGSTGRPKGVVVPHRGVARLVKGTDYVSLTEKEVLLHLSPLSFDASTFELWGALLNGGRVILMPPGPPALSEIAAAIRRHGVTTAWLTAGLFHLMVEEHLDDLKPLRQLLAGGDVLSPEHVRKARRGLPHCRIINGYGPTENTTFTCCHTVREERDLSPSVPIGGPIANTRVYVLDSFQQPVPVGVRGELYAGGDGVACGYLHQPELTAERFLPDPYSEQPGARLYRTGDQVRWRPDGTLEFLGRMDSQVKIRGFRVELGEIENVLLGQPNVREAVVVAREGFSGDKRLTAYLVPRVPTQPDNLALQAALAEKLPVYMVPDSLVWLDKIPLTANGKVDRQALPVPDARETQESVGQRTDVLEWELSRIWRKLFQRENIGRQDNFFALGGHSLLATRLAAEVEKALGASLPVSAVFQSPTIESLARRFADENWSVQWSSLVPLHPTGTQPPLYILHGIEGDLFRFVELAQLLGPDQPVYGIQAVGLDGKSPRHASIEEMAAHYVSEIVSFQTEGPFYLAGYSLGGLIAFEVARQLHLRGRRVALLALLDCAPVGPTPWRFHALSLATYFAGDVRFHWQRWSKLPGHEKIGYLLARLESIPRAITGKRRKATAGTTTTPPETPSQSDYYEKTALAHRLQPYPGRADFFVSDEGVYGLRWTIYGWRWYWQYLVRGGVSFHRVPGLHLEIFSADKLPALANALARVLRRRQKENEPPAVPQPPVGPAKE
jgi:amino acid adenylation domain-containing protein